MTHLLYLLVGAGLVMAAQVLIQQRVKAPKRREDRWGAGRAGAGLLTAELPDRANDALPLTEVDRATSRSHGRPTAPPADAAST